MVAQPTDLKRGDDMLYCGRCGEWNEEDAVHSWKCGRRLESGLEAMCPKCQGERKVFSGMPRINWGIVGIDEHGYMNCSECGGTGKRSQ